MEPEAGFNQFMIVLLPCTDQIFHRNVKGSVRQFICPLSNEQAVHRIFGGGQLIDSGCNRFSASASMLDGVGGFIGFQLHENLFLLEKPQNTRGILGFPKGRIFGVYFPYTSTSI